MTQALPSAARLEAGPQLDGPIAAEGRQIGAVVAERPASESPPLPEQAEPVAARLLWWLPGDHHCAFLMVNTGDAVLRIPVHRAALPELLAGGQRVLAGERAKWPQHDATSGAALPSPADGG